MPFTVLYNGKKYTAEIVNKTFNVIADNKYYSAVPVIDLTPYIKEENILAGNNISIDYHTSGITINSTSEGTITGATNGLSITGSKTKLGGALTGNTTLDLNVNNLTFTGTTGNLNLNAKTLFNNQFLFNKKSTPAIIAANQNNYNPSGLTTVQRIRVSSNAQRNITGLSGGTEGRIVTLENVGSNNILIPNQSSSSNAANRFSLGGGSSILYIQSGQSVTFIYDGILSRWKPLTKIDNHAYNGIGPDTNGYYTLGGSLTNDVNLQNVSDTNQFEIQMGTTTPTYIHIGANDYTTANFGIEIFSLGAGFANTTTGFKANGFSSRFGVFDVVTKDNDRVYIESLTDGNDNGILQITDNRATTMGLQYAADYAANFGIRSLVDKGYVTGLTAGLGGSGITGATNGLTVIANNKVSLGGTLTGNTVLLGNFNLQIGTNNSYSSSGAKLQLVSLSNNPIISTTVYSGRTLSTPVQKVLDSANSALLEIRVPHSQSLAIGVSALGSLNTALSSIIAIGAQTLGALTGTSGAEIAIGSQSLVNITRSAGHNIAIGSGVLNTLSGSTTTGSNIAFGTNAFSSLNKGIANLGIGVSAGLSLTSGNYNIFLGRQSGSVTPTTNSSCIVIGSYCDVPVAATSGQLNIGNVLYGTGLYATAAVSSTPTTTGNIGIGLTTPTARLHLAAGTTSANSAPLKFTSGSLLTTAVAGAVEFLTDKYYGTITTGAARKELALVDAAMTTGQGVYTTTNGRVTSSANLLWSGSTNMFLNANFKLNTAGNGLYIKEGTNATSGIKTLTGGTAVVSTTKVTASSRVHLTSQGGGSNHGAHYISARTAGTSFTITSTNASDTDAIAWTIIEPA